MSKKNILFILPVLIFSLISILYVFKNNPNPFELKVRENQYKNWILATDGTPISTYVFNKKEGQQNIGVGYNVTNNTYFFYIEPLDSEKKSLVLAQNINGSIGSSNYYFTKIQDKINRIELISFGHSYWLKENDIFKDFSPNNVRTNKLILEQLKKGKEVIFYVKTKETVTDKPFDGEVQFKTNLLLDNNLKNLYEKIKSASKE